MAIRTPTRFYIPSLDGIRALAFSLVFVAHAGLGHLVPGGFGVTIFFFLSGYLITTLLRKEFEETGRIHFRQFYARRALRIFPPFYITLTFLVVLTLLGFLPGRLALAPIVAQATFLTNYYGLLASSRPAWPAGTDVFWSLAVEEHFYVIFPLLATFLLGKLAGRARAAVLVVACLGFLAWRCLLVFQFHRGEAWTYSASDTRMDSILFGSILALWCNPMMDPPVRLTTRSRPAIYAASLGLLLSCLLLRDPRFRETFRYTLQGIGLLPLFYLAVADHDRPWFRWLNWRWVRFLGILSYSLYLIHFAALELVSFHLPDVNPTLRAVLALALSLAYSLALHLAVERPLARLRKRLHSDSLPPSAGPMTAADLDGPSGRIGVACDASTIGR